MKKRNLRSLTALLSLTLLIPAALSGCGTENTNANAKKVVLNDDAPFFSFLKWK